MIPARLVVMGVAGCGKSSVGAALADRTGAEFLDGDDFHPEANVRKMSAGQPLTDADRWPWLDALGAAAEDAVARSGRVVYGCSALRRIYRERLTACARGRLVFLHLDGARSLIEARMAAREGHFMPTALLDSQFATLEKPESDEDALTLAVDGGIAEIVEAAIAALSDASA